MRALSAVDGSWKTTDTTRPMARRSAALRLVTSRPWKKTCPSVGACRPHMTLARVDLPEPDSPTRPILSPGASERVTSSTALTQFGLKIGPVRDLKCTLTLRRSMMGVVGAGVLMI